MRKLLNLIGLLLVSTLGSINPNVVGAKAAETVMPANYINISASETHVIWIPHVYRNYEYDTDEKYQLVFFNSNSKYEIASIEHINYSMKTVGSEHRTDGRVSSGENTTMNYRSSRAWFPYPEKMAPQYTTEYDYQNTQYIKVKDSEKTYLQGQYFAWFTKIYNINIPQLGKVNILKQTEQVLAIEDNDLARKLLFQYPTDKRGHDSVDAYFNYIRKNYEYYLIIPLSDETITLDYISIKAYDIHGNLITDEIGNITPVPGVAETYSFNVVKSGGAITQAGTAIHFTGTNRFKLTGLSLSNVVKEVSDPNVQSDVYVYAGNLIGKTTLAGVIDAITKAWKLTPGVKLTTSYLFNGMNNSLLIDIPSNVTSATITVEYFKDVSVTHTGVDQPILYNLLDKNGTYGIRGGNGQIDPNLGSNWFLKWLNGLGINLENLGVGEIVSYALIALGAVLLIVLVIKFGSSPRVKIYNSRN